MARFPKLPPVVFVAIQLPIFLIVPVREGILAFRTPETGNMPSFINHPVEALTSSNEVPTSQASPDFFTCIQE